MISNKYFIYAINKLHLNYFFFKLFARKDIIRMDSDTVSDAIELLSATHPDANTSCFRKNIIDKKVDLHIIIPCYNAEKYISKCIESIVNAEHRYTYRVVVVDDGSTDSSGAIIDKFKSNPNVIIIHQENKGHSGSRNKGLEKIYGKYIMFVDADDYVDYENVEKLLDLAIQNDADIVEGASTTFRENGKVKRVEKYPNGKVSSRTMRGMPWGKIIRSELFENVIYPLNYWYEDSIFAQIIYPNANTALKSELNVYCYLDNSKGVTRTSRGKAKSIDSVWVTKKLLSERIERNMILTQDDYEYMLRQLKLTHNRTKNLNDNIKKAVFIVYADMVNQYFGAYKTQESKMYFLEKSVKEYDYGTYNAFCTYY